MSVTTTFVENDSEQVHLFSFWNVLSITEKKLTMKCTVERMSASAIEMSELRFKK